MPSTKHMVVDIKTGHAYGLRLDDKGELEAIQPLNLSVERLDGTVANKFGPSLDPMNNPILPAGKTTYAVEMRQDGKAGKLFTIQWPKKKDLDAGVLPKISHKILPSDLVRAGIAAPIGAPAEGQGVDNDEVLKAALKNIDDMIGLESAKRDIKQNIAVARFNKAKIDMGLDTKPISRHMVFTGNPGTGKTTFAREVAKVYHALGFIKKAEVTEVKREDLVAGYVGQTALKTKEVIDKAKGGVLFIDEAYALSRAGDGPGGSNDFGREAIDTLVAAMENMRDDLIVIVAGYPGPMKRFIDANEGLKSRFMTYIGFDDYGMEDLGKIMDFMLQERGYTMSSEAREYAMGLLREEKDQAQKDFGNGRTVRNLVEKAEKEMAMRLENENVLGKGHGLTEEALKAKLTTLTLEDIEKVTLQGLGAKTGLGIGFGQKARKKSNDNVKSTPPAPGIEGTPAEERKVVLPVTKNSFKL